jgi:protein O-GlcNAc transferase
VGLFDRLKIGSSVATSGNKTMPVTSANDPMSLLEKGIASEDAGQMHKALKYYEDALQLDPALGRAHFNRGNVLLAMGEPQGALDAFRKALIQKPDSAAAYYNIGNAHARLGQNNLALASYQQAITLKPDFADAHVAMGVALQDIERNDDAIASYRKALAIMPDYPEVHYNLGNVLMETGKLDEAVTSLQQAVACRPDYAEAHRQLGQLFQSLDRLGEAEQSYRQVLRITPESAEDHNNLAVVLENRGQLEAAIASYHHALDITPESPQIYSNLGGALKSLGRFDEALASYRQALTLKPDFAQAYSNLGAVLHQRELIVEAMAYYQKAIEIDPNCFDAHNNRGVALQQGGQFNAALASYRRTLEINPDFAESMNNIGALLADLGRLEEATASYRQALNVSPNFFRAHSNLLLIHNYLADQTPAELLAEAIRYGDGVAREARPYSNWRITPDPTRCLRVGIVSADLYQHPVGFFLEGVVGALTAQARDRLDFVAYSNYSKFDEVSERIKVCCQDWQSILGISDEILAKRIRDDRIDILIDLSGHTGHNRLPLFAWKPAPVQVSWLGYFATTGVKAIDYLVADTLTLPESEEINFTEAIWRLPETRLCFTPPTTQVEIGTLPAFGNGSVTFGCFNNLTKMNDSVVNLWARILKELPESRLFLKTKQLDDPFVQQSVLKRFAEHGINKERLILEPHTPRADYLAAYNRVDIALDPFPFTGGTTTVETLWMGVPVLTLAGHQFLARQGVGLLMNAGLPEWVANDQDDYLSRAVSYASDLQRLASLRAGLRQQILASPIFDAPRFARHFEAALRSMWEKWCHDQGAPPSEQTSPLSSVK